MINYIKRNILLFILFFVLIGVGLFFIIPSGKAFISIFSYIAFVYLILLGISFFVMASQNQMYLSSNNKYNNRFSLILQGLFLLTLGAIILIFPNYMVRAVIGICLLIIPLYKLIYADNKWLYLRNNFWKFLIALLFILAFDSIIDIVFMIIGILFIGMAIYLLFLFVKNYKYGQPNVVAKYIVAYIVRRSNK